MTESLAIALSERPTIDDQIKYLQRKIEITRNAHAGLTRSMKMREEFNIEDMEKRNNLNEELRTLKITEAELVYFRNQL
jgi:hypothetical protein